MGVVFEPGSLGIKYEGDGGAVTDTAPGGQGDRLGVKKGWQFHQLEDWRFSEDRLKGLAAGTQSFPVTFTRAQVADLVEVLVTKKEYDGVSLPCWSELQRSLKEKTVIVPDYRERLRKNMLAVKKASVQDVAVNVLIDSTASGTACELDETIPRRPRVKVWLNNGTAETVLLGNVEFPSDFLAKGVEAEEPAPKRRRGD